MAGMDVKIESNFAELPIWINKKVLKQMVFATSVALYETAKEASYEVRSGLTDDFTIRNRYVAQGIRIKPTGSKAIRATGRGIEGMSAEVGSLDDFMERQEMGGTKLPTLGKNVAIPIRENKHQAIKKSQWPSAILGKKRGFVQRSKRGTQTIYERTTRGPYPIKPRYILKPQVRVRARWDMRQTVQDFVGREYHRKFETAFEKAMATAK